MNNEKQFNGRVLAIILNARNIVFVAMLAVGTLCIYMSARNTASYLLLTGMEKLMALMTGVALIVFSATSFTAAQLFLAQKGAAKLFSILFVAVGITVIVFSIFSTLSLNYSKFITSDAIKDDIADKIERRRSELIREYQASGEQAEGQDINQWAMNNFDRLLSMAETSGTSWNNSMRTVMEMSQNISTNIQTERRTIDDVLQNTYIETIPRTFFGFMLNIGNLENKYFFDFFMVAVPAVFYDLISPLAVTVVLFLMGFQGSRKETDAEVQTEIITSAPILPKEEPPDIKDLNSYIENAMQNEFQILPDEAVPNIDAQKCAKLRKYLSSFIYKGNALISEKDGQYISIFDKSNFIRLITLLSNVQRGE
jgi:hypothetical protein